MIISGFQLILDPILAKQHQFVFTLSTYVYFCTFIFSVKKFGNSSTFYINLKRCFDIMANYIKIKKYKEGGVEKMHQWLSRRDK